MFKKIRERNTHLILIFFLCGIFLGSSLSFVRSAQENTLRYLDYFHFVYQSIKKEFVEEKKSEVLLEGAMQGMLQSLNDPYSRYLDEKQYAQFKTAVTGNFVGIGVEITVKDGDVIVIAPIEGSPARSAGILAGDIIVKVDDNQMRGKNLNAVIKKIKGKPGTKTIVYVRRKGFSELLNFEIIRKAITVKSTRYGTIKEQPGIGYIKISHFYETSASEIDKILKKFNKQQIKKMILDLRGNPGGNLNAAIQISDMFLAKDKVIVTTRGRKSQKSEDNFKATSDQLFKGKLIVLVNKGSASASEVLAGALQDNKRAPLAGQKTFGKALVQQLIDINPGKTGFTLTIRKYYTPNGALIHKKGIAPDHKMPEDLIPEKDLKNLGRIINDKLFHKFAKTHKIYKKENIEKLLSFLESNQLKISERTAAYYFKRELNRYKKASLYDLEFDSTLSQAIKLINE